MIDRTIYKPAAFFLIAIFFTSVFEFIAAWFSFREDLNAYYVPVMFIAISMPFATALFMHYRAKSPELWRDYRDRFFNLKRINPSSLPVILFLMPVAMLASISISVLLGRPAQQFTLTPQGSFTAGHVPVMLFMLIVPLLEELGWRGYGVDSLRSRFHFIGTWLWFASLWAAWHIPTFFINHTYMHGLLANPVYAANYFISIFPMAFILNWVFYKNNRSIIACFILHSVVDMTAEIFAVEQFTKCIETAILMLVMAFIMITDRKFIFDNAQPEIKAR